MDPAHRQNEIERLREMILELETQVRHRTEALAEANRALEAEIAERLEVEEALRQARAELEQRVAQRTEELQDTNRLLQTEIAEREQAEEALTYERYLYQALLGNIPLMVYFKDAAGRFIQVNQAQARWLGVEDPAQVLNRTDFDFFAEEHAHAALADEQEIMISGRPLINQEEKEKWPDGRVTWVLTTKMPLQDHDGRVVGTFGTSLDITERREAEEQVRKSELQLAEAQKIARLGSWEWDIANNRLRWSIELFRIYGLTPEEFEGSYQAFLGRVHPQDREAVNRQIQETLHTRKPFDFYHRIIRPDGRERVIQARGRVILNDAGHPRGLVGTGQDATERKQAEQLLVQQQALEQSNRELEQFAYIASHDLQEPLRKILAFGDRLKMVTQGVFNEQAQDYLDRMLNAAQRMQTLINDLLVYSRVTRHISPLVPVDLGQIVGEVLSDLEARLEATQGRVEASDLPTIEADALHMRQLFQNLIGNALKFHRPGVPPEVQVKARIITDPGKPTGPGAIILCEISVADNGIGFDEKYVNQIFAPFQRLHGRGEYEGTGIGLAICQRIVERHQGKITASSVPDQGSVFIITLPVGQPS